MYKKNNKWLKYLSPIKASDEISVMGLLERSLNKKTFHLILYILMTNKI
jgi:hypothetical protein